MYRGTVNPLTEEQLNAVHRCSLETLENVGILAKNTPAKDIYSEHGAIIDGDIVKIPRSMVSDALDSVRSAVVLYGRRDRESMELADRNVYLGTGGAALNVIDVGEDSPRTATIQDVARLARLVDNLDDIDFYLRPVVAQDIPKEKLDSHKFYASLSNTTKHVMGSVSTPAGYEEVKKLASMVAGSLEEYRAKPFLSFITCWMRSPLTLDPGPTDLMMRMVNEGLPVVLSSAPMAGSTAPVTLAGCLVQLHAEILSGAVLTQLVNPGAPVIFGYVPSVANPQTMGYLGGSAEFGMLNAAAVQLASHHGLPNYCSAGLTEAKVPDAQAGIEKMLTVLQVAQAGGNYIHHAAGMLESMLSVSYAQYVIDNDIIGMVKRVLRGFEINDDTLAMDVIAETGPNGNYMANKHTVRHLRKEYFFPKISDRKTRREWEKGGSKELWERATDVARDILEGDKGPKLEPEVVGRIEEELGVVVK